MAVDDKKNDISDFQDLDLEDLVLDTGHHHHTTPSYGFYDDFYSGPLCVPQDSLYGLDWYPNFVDDFISLSENEIEAFLHEYSGDNTSNDDLKNDFFYESGGNLVEAPVTPTQIDQEKKRTQLKKYCRISSNGVSQFGHKKRRTIPSRRPGGRRQIWCSKESFIGDQIVPGHFSDGHVKRRCSHCQTEDTPQWRMGPLGPKTLCNACGVRHKSGRLLPEYRPVASPTFDVGKHSNFHRKIMKRKGINAY